MIHLLRKSQMESVLSSACGMIAGVGCIRWDLFPTEVLPRYRWMGGTPWAVKLIAFLAVLLAPSRNADSNLAADPKIHDDEVRFCVFPTHVCILLLDSPCKAVQSFSLRPGRCNRGGAFAPYTSLQVACSLAQSWLSVSRCRARGFPVRQLSFIQFWGGKRDLHSIVLSSCPIEARSRRAFEHFRFLDYDEGGALAPHIDLARTEPDGTRSIHFRKLDPPFAGGVIKSCAVRVIEKLRSQTPMRSTHTLLLYMTDGEDGETALLEASSTADRHIWSCDERRHSDAGARVLGCIEPRVGALAFLSNAMRSITSRS